MEKYRIDIMFVYAKDEADLNIKMSDLFKGNKESLKNVKDNSCSRVYTTWKECQRHYTNGDFRIRLYSMDKHPMWFEGYHE